ARFGCQPSQELGVPGFGEARLIKEVLGDGIGDHGTGRTGKNVAHRAADRGKRGWSARLVWTAGLGRYRHARIQDRKRSVEDGADRWWLNRLDFQIGSDPLCATTNKSDIANQVEGRKLKLSAPSPGREGDIWTDSGGFSQGQDQRLRHSTPYLYS